MELRTQALLHRILLLHHSAHDSSIRKDKGEGKSLEIWKLLPGRFSSGSAACPTYLQKMA